MSDDAVLRVKRASDDAVERLRVKRASDDAVLWVKRASDTAVF